MGRQLGTEGGQFAVSAAVLVIALAVLMALVVLGFFSLAVLREYERG
ncbi:putative membrane protein [Mycobacterium xenopi 4042]|uniref:Putative membrane protein n=1 Tax=Mycobacterium xenopi 4042 TaxID=1299334 RepID=X8DXE8_MYCXE|nr:putative membrane protein [Mycobacterium xenopi 3993]EUA73292.1 putative membrane protein [Mycobacterium xenopi 4042]